MTQRRTGMDVFREQMEQYTTVGRPALPEGLGGRLREGTPSLGEALLDSTLGSVRRDLARGAAQSDIALQTALEQLEGVLLRRHSARVDTEIHLHEANRMSEVRIRSAEVQIIIQGALAEAEVRRLHAAAARDSELASLIAGATEVLLTISRRLDG